VDKSSDSDVQRTRNGSNIPQDRALEGHPVEIRELRHETLDMLQAVLVLTARLKHMLPPDAADQRSLLEQLVQRAHLCRDRIAGEGANELDGGTASALAETVKIEPAAGTAAEPLENAASLPRLRVVVVEDDPAVRSFLADTIRNRCGHNVVATAATGPDMVREVLRQQADLVVFDIHLPGMDGLTALHAATQEHPIAAVAVTGDRNLALVRRALEDNILAYLLKPVDANQVAVAIQVAWARFNEFCQLRSENQSLQQTLKDRKTIERAKGVLMKKHRWSEATAFRSLQRTAMSQRRSMAQLAQEILDGKDVSLLT
jgi:AmiR/NasT family two-component response regulator